MASLLRMPEISANTVEAVLADWPLSVNSAFAAGDAIATVETEKAVVDVPAEFDGVLLRTLIEPGKSVSVGTPLAVLGSPGEAVEDLDVLVEELTGKAGPEAINEGAADEPSPAGTREVTQGAEPSSEDARGDDPTAQVTASASRAVPGPADSRVAAGLTEATRGEATSGEVTSGAAMSGEATNGKATNSEADGSHPHGGGGAPARIFASPLARRIARENGLAIGDIHGTGPGGRIVRDDVRRAAASRPELGQSSRQSVAGAGGPPELAVDPSASPSATIGASPTGQAATAEPASGLLAPSAASGTASSLAGLTAGSTAAGATGSATSFGGTAAAVPGVAANAVAANYADIPHSRMRRAIAGRLAESNREAPVFSIRGSARVDDLLALRRELNAVATVKISVNDLVVAAAARAHVAVPEMNVIWMPDAVRRFADVDIAVAVATGNGLVTPVVRGVQRLTVSALAATNADLATRARAGRLRQSELDGGTLTVTNLGGFGTEDFTAVINPPQAAILAVGAARQEAVVTNGELGIGTTLKVTLSVDHRPVDGATGARWMAAFLAFLETPLRILI
jgi:pyruvate dehydrogenase E2 component (dihydrolipoamide acetyltransferase)